MIGLAEHERVDEELYDDFESAKAREVCMQTKHEFKELCVEKLALGPSSQISVYGFMFIA